jgi:hypothetical protein
MFLAFFAGVWATWAVHANSAFHASLVAGHDNDGVKSTRENNMELRDLNPDERIALAALVEFVVLASGHATEDEEREIDAIVEELGEDEFRKATEEVDKRFPDEEAARKFLKTITRPEARELIYGAVLDAAMTDTIEGRESQMLEWIAKEWDIKVEFESPPEE